MHFLLTFFFFLFPSLPHLPLLLTFFFVLRGKLRIEWVQVKLNLVHKLVSEMRISQLYSKWNFAIYAKWNNSRKKILFIVGMGLGCFASRKLLGGVFLSGGTNTAPIKMTEDVCRQMRAEHTHTTKWAKCFQSTTDDLITKRDCCRRANLRFRSPKQAIRVNLHSLKWLFHFPFIPTWKLRDLLKE